MPRGKHRVLRAATYNVHSWVGRDGRSAPGRCLGVINNLGADLVALQEATLPYGPEGMATSDFLAKGSGMRVILGVTMQRPDTHFGNVLLSRIPVSEVRLHDITDTGQGRGSEPRGVIDAVLSPPGWKHPLRVLATHLGLTMAERGRQSRRLLKIAASDNLPCMLLGDCNTFFPWNLGLRPLFRVFRTASTPASFPAVFPLLSLDRVAVRGALRIHEVEAWRQGEARVASDHLPVVAEVGL